MTKFYDCIEPKDHSELIRETHERVRLEARNGRLLAEVWVPRSDPMPEVLQYNTRIFLWRATRTYRQATMWTVPLTRKASETL